LLPLPPLLMLLSLTPPVLPLMIRVPHFTFFFKLLQH
jgi:hypothetical protein